MVHEEVLEHGAPTRPRTRRLWIAIICVAAVVLAFAVTRALLAGEPSSRELAIDSITMVKATSIDPNAAGSGWPIKVGMPADAELPGAELLVTVSGDRQRAVEVRTAQSGGALSLEPIAVVEIPAGGQVEIPVTVAPLDCGVTDSTLDEAGYRWRRATGVQVLETTESTALPLSDLARDELSRVLSELCAPAGSAPTVSMIDARLDGPYRDQVLDITAAVESDSDRALLHPLDGPGLRGIGSFTHPGDLGVTLMWAVAPLAEDTDGVLDALVRVITVVDGTAYPWIVRIVPPAALRAATPLRAVTDG